MSSVWIPPVNVAPVRHGSLLIYYAARILVKVHVVVVYRFVDVDKKNYDTLTAKCPECVSYLQKNTCNSIMKTIYTKTEYK